MLGGFSKDAFTVVDARVCRRRSGHSDRVASQAVRLVNRRCPVPLSMSSIDVRLITGSWVSLLKGQPWQVSS